MGEDHDDAVGPMSVVEVAALAKLFQEHRSWLLAMLQRRLDPRLGVTSGSGISIEEDRNRERECERPRGELRRREPERN
jgi:hypothetical protein